MSHKKWRALMAAFITVFVISGNALAGTEPARTKAKYVFLFIGDGMAVAQRNAAELFLAKENGASRPEDARLVMNTFPAQGMDTTFDLTSIIPDSASRPRQLPAGTRPYSASSVWMPGAKFAMRMWGKSLKNTI